MPKSYDFTIENSSFSRSPVNVLIPFHGQYEKVSSLVKSIWTATKSNPYQICLIDDGSPNKDFILSFKKAPQVITVRNEQRMGYGASLLKGYEITKQPWVIFLNSDCLVRDGGWMIEMGRSLLQLKEQGVRMVSARSDNPGQGVHPFLTASFGESTNDTILEEGHLPLYCVMAHRELFSRIGFIKNYPLCWYEDTEFAFRMKKNGYKQAICGKSWIHHDGAATLKEICEREPKARQDFELNWERCRKDIGIIS